MTALRRRVLEDMQVRQLSPHTQRAYVNNISQFARYFGRSPDVLGPQEIRAYQQVYLTNERKLAPSSIGMAVSAHLPYVVSLIALRVRASRSSVWVPLKRRSRVARGKRSTAWYSPLCPTRTGRSSGG